MKTLAEVLLAYLTMIGALVLSLEKRISGGIEVPITQFPYFGYIASSIETQPGDAEYTPLCGAVLISEDYILTEESCVHRYSQRQLFVQFGMKSWCPPLEYVEELHYWSNLKYVYTQRDYKGIAVVLLGKKIPITPISAPQSAKPFQNALFGLPGLGRTGPNSLQTCKPHVAQLVPVGPNSRGCPAKYYSGVLCFQPNYNNKLHGSMCYRDEGGPIIERIESNDYLRGIAWKNVNSDCQGMNLARDVWAALPWIQQIVPSFR